MAAQSTTAHPAIMEAQAAAKPTTSSSLPAPIFSTPRLLIRPLHPQDAPSMSQHANNPAVADYMTLAFPSPYTLESAEGWITMNSTAPILNWGICLRDAPNEVIGGCGLKPGVDVKSHAVEIGFWIGEAFWGKGLVTEVLRGMVEWVFTSEESKLAGKEGVERWTRVWGGVVSGNEGSRRCFLKCGFASEGTLRGAVVKHGRVSDLWVLGLLKAEWEERRKGE